MNFSFKIVLYKGGYGGYIYTILLEDETLTELEKFLREPKNKSCPEYKSLVARLHHMVERQGFRRAFFKHNESKITNTISAFHYGSKSLRLYCCYSSQLMIIAGGGGCKGKGSYQNYPECYEAVQILEEVDKRIIERVRDRGIKIESDGKLTGDLDFVF